MIDELNIDFPELNTTGEYLKEVYGNYYREWEDFDSPDYFYSIQLTDDFNFSKRPMYTMVADALQDIIEDDLGNTLAFETLAHKYGNISDSPEEIAKKLEDDHNDTYFRACQQAIVDNAKADSRVKVDLIEDIVDYVMSHPHLKSRVEDDFEEYREYMDSQDSSGDYYNNHYYTGMPIR